MTTTVDRAVDQAIDDEFERLCSIVRRATPEQLVEFARYCPPEDLALLERAVAHVTARGVRADPLSLARHLEPDEHQPWKYTQLLARKWTQLVDGTSKRQMWMLPARYGKTRWGSIWGPIWGLDNDPRLKLILTSYGAELADENAGEVRDKIEEYGDELQVRLRRDRRKRNRWVTTEGGALMSAGVGGRMTGFGADVIVVDDPFKNWEEARSLARREMVWNWFLTVVSLRLQQDDSAILIISTRWHEDDLQGRLLDPPGDVVAQNWDVTRIPVLAEDPEASTSRKWWERLPDPLGRAPGEIIEPGRFSHAAVLARLTGLSSFLAAALEFQRPAPAEGGIVKRAWWRYYGALPNPLELDGWLTSWDMSFKDAEEGSYVVGQVWARHGGGYYLIDQVRDHMDFPTAKQAVINLARKHPKCTLHLIEDKANGPAIIADLTRKIPGLVPIEPKGSKESRLHACSSWIESGNVHLPQVEIALPPDQFDHDLARRQLRGDTAWVADFVEEVCGFPNYPTDDQVDSMTQALVWYQEHQWAADAADEHSTTGGHSALDKRR